MVDKIARMRRISAILSEELGREPTQDELAEELGIPHKKLALLERAAKRPTSLNAPVHDDDSAEFSDIIGDEHAVNPFEALDNKNMYGELDDLLDVLDEREHRIIDARFGLDGKTPMTLEEVGVEFGVTRERIRQLQNIALEKMRKALHRKETPMPEPTTGSLAEAS